MRSVFLFIFICGICPPLIAQEKYERERRISAEEVPVAAINFLDSCEFDSKIRWHEEESLDHRSVEASVKESGLKYSIEFDMLGRIEDVEIDQRESEVPATTMASIHQYLDNAFNRYRIKNIQVQWSGGRSRLIECIRSSRTDIPHTTRYELIVKGRDETGFHEYEFLFSDQGEFLQRSVLIFRTTDHLDY